MTIKAHWKGDEGQYLNGVPARSLDEDEYDALDKDRRKAVRESGLYRMAEDKPADAPKPPAAQPSAPDAGGRPGS